MIESSIFDEIPEELSHNLVQFSEAIEDIDQLIRNYENPGVEASNLDLVKNQLSLCYVYNALFFMFLRSNGVDTSEHPIMQELDRVMTALRRCRSLTETYHTTARLKCDKEATSRFIKHALWQSAHTKAKKRRLDNKEPSTSSKHRV